MADVKISDLPAVTTVDPAVDVLPLVSDSGTVTTKATPGDLLSASLLGISGSSGQILTYVDNTTTPIWGPRDAGPSGYSGISGYSGYSGIDGASGYSGIDGASGYSGIDGASGYSGYSGTNGTTTLQTVALADLQDKTSTVNTVGKVEGLVLFEPVTPQIVVASGSADTDPWQTFAAGTAITPSTP